MAKANSFLFIFLLCLVLGGGLLIFLFHDNTRPLHEAGTFYMRGDTVTVQTSSQGLSLAALVTVAVVLVAGFAFWLAALVRLLTSRHLESGDKIVWTLVLIFLNLLGAVLYFCLAPAAVSKEKT